MAMKIQYKFDNYDITESLDIKVCEIFVNDS